VKATLRARGEIYTGNEITLSRRYVIRKFLISPPPSPQS